jgi:rare lipoprotein A
MDGVLKPCYEPDMVARSRLAIVLLALAPPLLLNACGGTVGPASSPGGTPIVGHYKVGQPYQIKGRWYRPEYDPNYSKVGTASWYGAAFHGLPTANGEVFDKEQISAAHPTLPLPSIVRVTNLENGRSLELRVNDRGPFIGDRLIDLSEAAARELGYDDKGLARVRVDFVALAEDATGTPPRPTVAAAAPPPAPAPAERASSPPPREVQVAALPPPPARRVAASCATGPQLVQIGAFGETDQVSAAMADVDGLEQVRVEPAFAGDRAVARVRLGPVADPQAAKALLERVVAMGYTDAFMVPAGGAGRATVTC